MPGATTPDSGTTTRYPMSRSSESRLKPQSSLILSNTQPLDPFDAHNHISSKKNTKKMSATMAPVSKKRLNGSKKNTLTSIPRRLKSLETQFSEAQQQQYRNIDQIMREMPLQYVHSVPQLKKYAVERACHSLCIPAVNKIRGLLRLALRRWRMVVVQLAVEQRNEPPLEPDDRQIGFLVLLERLNTLVMKQCRKYFKVWHFKCSSKFDRIRTKRFNDSAYIIQYWFSQRLILRRQPFKDAIGIFLMCLHRRKAIYHMISFEHRRRAAVQKIRRGVANRRRYYFAARIIQRIVRWVLIYREMKFRLTRKIYGECDAQRFV